VFVPCPDKLKRGDMIAEGRRNASPEYSLFTFNPKLRRLLLGREALAFLGITEAVLQESVLELLVSVIGE
jgi:hypothetical protein